MIATLATTFFGSVGIIAASILGHTLAVGWPRIIHVIREGFRS